LSITLSANLASSPYLLFICLPQLLFPSIFIAASVYLSLFPSLSQCLYVFFVHFLCISSSISFISSSCKFKTLYLSLSHSFSVSVNLYITFCLHLFLCRSIFISVSVCLCVSLALPVHMYVCVYLTISHLDLTCIHHVMCQPPAIWSHCLICERNPCDVRVQSQECSLRNPLDPIWQNFHLELESR
jgi:hypothetical protein